MKWLIAPLMLVSMAIPLPSPEPPTHPPPTAPSYLAVTLLSVGDSITSGANGAISDSYRLELSRLLNKTGQPHTWQVAALPGSNCHHWALYVEAAINQYHPNIMFLNCGTNDTPSDNTEADYRTILDIAAAHSVQVVASLIGLPDMKSSTNIPRPYIYGYMEQTNLAIKKALTSYPNVAVANFERIPANPEWLKTDGIHWTARAEAGAAQLFYKAARPTRGWKTFAQMSMTEMCGLNGVRPNEPWLIPNVDYRVCAL